MKGTIRICFEPLFQKNSGFLMIFETVNHFPFSVVKKWV